ncbi:hypothetical protein Tco_0312580 [Tanacetum coccineum]
MGTGNPRIMKLGMRRGEKSPWGSPIPIEIRDEDEKRFPNGDGDGDGDKTHKWGWGCHPHGAAVIRPRRPLTWRGVFSLWSFFSSLLFFISNYSPFESFIMSLEESDELNIPNGMPVEPDLEASSIPKFDMHLYRSSLTEDHVTYLVRLYGIPLDLYPRDRAGKNCKPRLKDAPTSLKKWKDKFFLVDRKAAPIAMAWRHHDSSVTDPFPGPSEYDASYVEKLWEVVISLRRPPLSVLYVACLSNVWKHAGRAFSLKEPEGKVITMAEFLRLPNFKGCKVTAGALLPPGTARVLDDKESKKRKTKRKVVAHAPAGNIQVEAVAHKGVGGEGRRKKKRVRIQPEVVVVSDQVSSPNPLNQARPLEALADARHVSLPLFVGRMDNLRDQTEEHASPPAALANRPSPAPHFGRRLNVVEEPALENVAPEAEARSLQGVQERVGLRPISSLDQKTSVYEKLTKNYDGPLTREKSLYDWLEELEEEKEKEKR